MSNNTTGTPEQKKTNSWTDSQTYKGYKVCIYRIRQVDIIGREYFYRIIFQTIAMVGLRILHCWSSLNDKRIQAHHARCATVIDL